MDPMQQQRQAAVFRAIAISTLPSTTAFSRMEREAAFTILQEFKRYEGRIAMVLPWLDQEKHVFDGQYDITIAAKLLALEILSNFLQQGHYKNINDAERLSLRQAVLKAARFTVQQSTNIDNGAASSLSQQQQRQEHRILSRKLAMILEGLVIRDFPQRWTSFSSDVLVPYSQGGLWYDPNDSASAIADHTGVQICLECFQLIAEDCTDSDFNSKISTQRRNDVLTGLNEIAHTDILPKLFHLLEQQYPALQQTKQSVHNMHTFLLYNHSPPRFLHQMTNEEAAMYVAVTRKCQSLAQLIADIFVTLEKFCRSMPMSWMLGVADHATEQEGTIGSVIPTNMPQLDFISAMMHLLREPAAQIQVRAVECLEQLVVRGKLEWSQWMQWITQLPIAVKEANQCFVNVEREHRVAEAAVKGNSTNGAVQQGPDSSSESLTLQLDFHRGLSRLLSAILSSHMAHITTASNKSILKGQGEVYEKFMTYIRLMVDLLHHPSGRICSEQISTWVLFLRDPQIVKAHVIQPFLQEVISCYSDQMIRIRWEDVDDELHPFAVLLSASFDDEDDYDAWMADLRSRTHLLFKFAANTEPHIGSKVMNTRVQSILLKHGNGEPLDHLDSSNQQLTQHSDAILQFEALYIPLDAILSGIPTWAMDPNEIPPSKDYNAKQRNEIRLATRDALSQMAHGLCSWNPSFLWLKLRRASLLEPLKHYWKHDPSTLLPAVDSLLRYLGLPDEWSPSSSRLSGEIVGLKKKSGVTLVAVSKSVPHHLVPWLSQLSEATRSLLSSEGLIPMNQMHLYEFLSCIATAVEDPVSRSNFISEVLRDAVNALESPDTQRLFTTVPALFSAFGISQAASDPTFLTNQESVRAITANYNRLFTALNRLLSVGRRCHEAARQRQGTGEISATAATASQSSILDAATPHNFTDEGPVSIRELARSDPFTPLWPRILPMLLQVYETTLSAWRPEFQSQLLANPYQRYIYAISDDEAYLSKNQDKKGGGVFGDGGTAGSVVTGTNRRELNLVPKWSGWFNELRNTCFQMLGLLATQRVLFAPEISALYPKIVAVLVDSRNLKSMEHRHIVQFMKHIVELFMTSCPSTLYKTHLEPIIGPVFEHMRYRLEKTWSPIIGGSAAAVSTGLPVSTMALSSSEATKAAQLASRGGDEAWFAWYYAHAGLFVGDLDAVTSEAAVEKSRVELSRTFADVLQVALALKGDWALVLANLAKEEQALRRNDTSKLTSGPINQMNDEGTELNADGTPKRANQAEIDGRKLLRINGLCHFLLLESVQIAGSLTLAIIQCLGYPDAYTCRRITKLCHRMLETVAWSPDYSHLLGHQMFSQVVKNLVTEPKWLVGLEWDMINIVRDIYCRLVLGQALQSGGQGAGLQQPAVDVSAGTNRLIAQYEQAKSADRPLQGGGILTVPCNYPREILTSLPGVEYESVRQLEEQLKTKRSAKDQKDCIRDLLRVAADSWKEANPTGNTSLGFGAKGSDAESNLFDRADVSESLLHSNHILPTVPDLPEKLVTRSQVAKATQKSRSHLSEPEGLAAFNL